MLEKLGQAIKKSMDKIANAVLLDKKTVEAIVKDLERALIQADIDIKLTKEISERLRKTAYDERIKGIEKKEHLIKAVHDSLLEILGREKQQLKIKKRKSQKIMLLGLYGAGKTTTIAKLANYYAKRGFKCCMLGLDVHRPAAPEQLEQLAKQHKLAVFIDKKEKNPEKIYKKYEKEINKYDLILIDTAGRDALDKALITEIKQLDKLIKPDYKIFVIPADIGQAAKKQAEEFNKIGINGTIITRMDSSAKGGGAITACYETKSKIFFITTGEKLPDIQEFDPESFISRILGLGDLKGLLEKIETITDKKTAEKAKEKLEEGKFTLDDFKEQIKQMSSMGPLGNIAKMIPGLSKKIPENLVGMQEDKIKKWEHAINSMTQEEKNNPEILEKQTSRIKRIAAGSGTNTSDIRQLVKQFKMLKELAGGGDMANMDMTQGLSQKQLMKLAKKFGKKMRF